MVFSLLAASAFLSLPSDGGEPPIGSRLPRPAYEEEFVNAAARADTYAVIQRFGACIVNADAKGSMALLITNPGTDVGYQALNKLKPLLPNCLVKASEGTGLYGTLNLQIPTPVLRGAIAATLYRQQFASKFPSALTKPAGVSSIMPPTESDPKAAQWTSWYAFTQCVTEAAPEDVRQLIMTKPSSDEEAAALSRLNVFMPACVAAGSTVKTDRNSLRFILADSLYRWSITAAQLSGTAANPR